MALDAQSNELPNLSCNRSICWFTGTTQGHFKNHSAHLPTGCWDIVMGKAHPQRDLSYAFPSSGYHQGRYQTRWSHFCTVTSISSHLQQHVCCSICITGSLTINFKWGRLTSKRPLWNRNSHLNSKYLKLILPKNWARPRVWKCPSSLRCKSAEKT